MPGCRPGGAEACATHKRPRFFGLPIPRGREAKTPRMIIREIPGRVKAQAGLRHAEEGASCQRGFLPRHGKANRGGVNFDALRNWIGAGWGLTREKKECGKKKCEDRRPAERRVRRLWQRTSGARPFLGRLDSPWGCRAIRPPRGAWGVPPARSASTDARGGHSARAATCAPGTSLRASFP